MTLTQTYVIRVRRGTEAQWLLMNPILADGEPGYASDVNLYKIGDGITPWNELSYVYGPQGPAGPQGPQGPAALSINYKGSVSNVESLPVGATLGDGYLVTDPTPDEVWVYGSNGWVYAGVAGVQGPQGPDGPPGPLNQEVVVSETEPTDPNVDFWVQPTDEIDGWGLFDARYGLKDETVSKAGDEMSGNLSIVTDGVAEVITDGAETDTSGLRIKQNGLTRWLFADDSNDRLVIDRYDKTTGLYLQTALEIDSDTGAVSAQTDPTLPNHLTKKAYVDAQGVYGDSSATISSVTATYAALNYVGLTSGYSWGGASWESDSIFRLTRVGVYLVMVRAVIASNAAAGVSSFALATSGGTIRLEFSDLYVPANFEFRHNAAFAYRKTSTAIEDLVIMAKNTVPRNYNYNRVHIIPVPGTSGF